MSVSQVGAISPTGLSSLSPMAQAQAAATTTTSSTGASLTSTTAGTTFLNLLVQELQNQDPSAPMDSTAMVGQMISLNQLDQLVSINQAVGGKATTIGQVTGGTATSNSQSVSSSALMAARAALLNDNASSPSSAQAATIAASDPNSVLQLSNLTNFSGAK